MKCHLVIKSITLVCAVFAFLNYSKAEDEVEVENVEKELISDKKQLPVAEKVATKIENGSEKKIDRRLNVLLNDFGKAIVQDIRKINVTKGKSQIYLSDIPFSVINDNLIIKPTMPGIEIANYEYRSFNKPVIELLKTMIGKNISYKIGEEIFSGKLISIYKDNDKDVIIINKNNVHNVAFLDKCQYLNLYNSGYFYDYNLLVDVIAQKDGEAEIELGYTLDGLYVDLLYIIETSKNFESVPMRSAAVIRNNTNIDFKNVTFTFGSVLDRVTGDKITVRTKTLNSGNRKVISLKKIDNQEIYLSYQVKIPHDFDGESIDLKARRVLSVKCPFILKQDGNNFLKTKALLKIDQNNQFYSVNSDVFGDNDSIIFDAGIAENININVKKINMKNLIDNSKDVSFVIKVTNPTPNEIDLSVILDIGKKCDIIKENVNRFSSKPMWKLLVPSNNSKELYCRVKLWE